MEDNGKHTSPSARAAALAALGIVYGDIGTSPLYAFRECFVGEGNVAVNASSILGVLSLIVWALIVVVSIKYLAYILRADNHGEGGILALLTLVLAPLKRKSRLRPILITIGLFGACLLYGDGMITPAISVLSAVEGLVVATPTLEFYVLPIAVVILIILFALQHRGTATIGGLFGPVMLLWFSTLALLALPHIIGTPRVLAALLPTHAISFLFSHGSQSLMVLGGVFLVVTGGEALYADLGHFGRRPIQVTWFFFVLPALIVHYFGQGALLINHPEAIENPFYLLAPSWALVPLILLSTLATVIASQAVITGAFSLTHQAIQLGYLPRLEIQHTSPTHIGQIYVPLVNWILLLSTVGLVLGFRSSGNLANAYGVAVVTTMLITTILGLVVSRLVWKWALPAALGISIAFLVVDAGFLSANILKIPSGGWLPLVVAAVMFFLMATWRRGHENVRRRLAGHRLEFHDFLEDLREHPLPRVPGLAVYLDGNPEGVPHTLLHNIKHNHVLHEQIVMLTIEVHEIPKVPSDERLEVVALEEGFFRAIAHVGFKEEPNIPALLRRAREEGLDYEGTQQTSFFLGRENLVRGRHHTMAWWREALFMFLARNQRPADLYFGLPSGRVVELGQQIPV